MAKPDKKHYSEQIKAARDQKVREHLTQYAPLWLIDERVETETDSVFFRVVFYHPTYHWVSRLYWYDAFSDVLHQRGQVPIEEAKALEILAKPPYIEAASSNSVLSYGG